ncbi:hypothetical protein C8046_08400 [Serinibacter arcticus]|uniref:DUF2264 domain-containing protein n=1 Tax=Serinibacter arcticus TaxID=1655435 RepID=A0A2U1ZUP2_9MICO|nr:hypothetical protein C8046_08400 [Serinibacter arcticus]
MVQDERAAREQQRGHQLDPGASPSPLSGWTRETWASLADHLLDTAQRHASPGHGRITFPGPAGGYGADVDGLEGFARTFLLGGFRLAGNRGTDPRDLAGWFARGLETGTDPSAPDRWVRLTEHPQAKVEAASLALVLDLTRPWIWDNLTSSVQERLVDYLAPAVGDDTYPRINWVWFRLVVQTFLRSVGGPHDLGEMQADLDTHDTFAREGGWLADGDTRAYDHYVGWALHLYPTLWARMAGATDLAAPRRERDRANLDTFLGDALALLGSDGAPLGQGRSLVYRFAAAAPFWVGAIAEVPSHSPGVLRRAASGVLSSFTDHGVPEDGVLTLGWRHAWPRLAQSYSGPSSPYWASKGFLGLSLPADHPVWTATEEPLPAERGPVSRTIAAPVWAVSSGAEDGVVRIANHGTDHARVGDTGADSPLYARLGYSTATLPLLDEDAWTAPLDQTVVLVDGEGRRSHRSGMAVLQLTSADGAVVAGSRSEVRWIAPDAVQHHHGSGYRGTPTGAGTLTTVSVLRGAWEVRLVHLADASADAVALEAGGWALASAAPPLESLAGGGDDTGDTPAVVLDDGAVRAVLAPLLGFDATRVERRRDASPLGDHAAVALASAPARAGWYALALGLGRSAATGERADGVGPSDSLDAVPGVTLTDSRALVAWADGATTSVDLPIPGVPGETEPGAHVGHRTS